MHKIGYYVPGSHLETTKQALFGAGAGRVGDYDHCCWQTQGEGQFRPLPGSRPFLGTEGRVERVEEYRVEMICADEHVAHAIAALRDAHPYEEPALDVVALLEV